MKKKVKRLLPLLFLLLSISTYSQTNFDSFFERKSLRIDFSLHGNSEQQQAAIQQLREEPVWGG
ncbi:MAG: peptidase M64, partial [Parabacteroides sp.]|nr:peptidase M64 [Parabacteroides sp.]